MYAVISIIPHFNNPTITYCRHVQRGATWKTSTYMCGGISWYKKLPKCYEVVKQRTKKFQINFWFLNALYFANKVVNLKFCIMRYRKINSSEFFQRNFRRNSPELFVRNSP